MEQKIVLGVMAGVASPKYTELLRGCCETWVKDVPGKVYFYNGQTKIDRIDKQISEIAPNAVMVYLPSVGDDYQSAGFKQYLGLSHMFNSEKDADWYGILGVDNYVNYERLQFLLSKYNPSVPCLVGGPPGVARSDVYYPFLVGGGGIFVSKAALSILMDYIPSVDQTKLEPYRKYDINSVDMLKLHLNWTERQQSIGGLTVACDVSLCYHAWCNGISLICCPELFSHDFTNSLENGKSIGHRLIVPKNAAIIHYMDKSKMGIYRVLSRTMNDAKIYINSRFKEAYAKTSDINEHIPTLRKYSLECQSIAECGVRSMVSTWAFLDGLKENGRLYCVDVDTPHEIFSVIDLAKKVDVSMSFIKGDSAKVTFPEKVDLLFIDTFHVYAHLKRELDHHHNNVNKYIIMHDTEVDAEKGEAIRLNFNIHSLAKQYDYPVSEIMKGLRPAIEEFIGEHPEWSVHYKAMNNNGLTVLCRAK